MQDTDAPPGGPRISRRQILRYASLLATLPFGAALLSACGEDGRESFSLDEVLRLTEQPVTLGPEQKRAVEAVVERLIPSDATGPGAREARVWRYIDLALGGDLASAKPLYDANLRALDALAQAEHGAPFADLRPDAQDALLTALEAGRAEGFTPDAATFFSTLHTHAMQGMFADPYHGGNANFAGWELISYPGINMVIPAEYGELGVDVPLPNRSVAQFGMFTIHHPDPEVGTIAGRGTGSAGHHDHAAMTGRNP